MTAREEIGLLFDCDSVLFGSHLSPFGRQPILHG